jgi:hypothetical protein
VRCGQRDSGTSHIAPPYVNSYIEKYEFIYPETYELIHLYEFISPGDLSFHAYLTFNRVGRRLRLVKRVADTLPASGRALVYCGLPCRPFSHEQTTSHFSAQKISKRAAPSAPPPIAILSSPPSPGAPLNNIQRVRSRSRADIEGGTGGFKLINII